jgi:DNA-binding response OmpR family regulator
MQGEMTRKSLAHHHEVTDFDNVGLMLERLVAGPRPDLLVLDWHMPEISGLEACRYVRGIADGAELPIVVLTATGHHDDLLQGLSAGANDFVRKPCEETELNARVARELSSACSGRPARLPTRPCPPRCRIPWPAGLGLTKRRRT